MRAVLLLVPHLEALELPGIVERANLQKPHAEYDISISMMSFARYHRIIYISTRHLLFAAFLTIPKEIFQISRCQERASSKRFLLCLPTLPLDPDRASAGRSASAKIYILLRFYKLSRKNLNFSFLNHLLGSFMGIEKKENGQSGMSWQFFAGVGFG